MVDLDKLVKDKNYIDITSNYYDFMESLHNPTVTEKDAYQKVHDDKIMQIKADKKAIKRKNAGQIYQRPKYEQCSCSSSNSEESSIESEDLNTESSFNVLDETNRDPGHMNQMTKEE